MEKVSNGLTISVKETGELKTEVVAEFLEKKVRETTSN